MEFICNTISERVNRELFNVLNSTKYGAVIVGIVQAMLK